MKERSRLLLHPLFIINLLVLLVNDIFWKYQYPSGLTGKLSDFSGLTVLSIFVSVLIPNKRSVIIFCFLFFTWWKSPFSQPVIDFINWKFNSTVHRVIDYSDLAALIMPFSIYIIKPPQIKFRFQTLAIRSVGIICLFAFCNTSPIRQSMYNTLRENEIRFYETFTTKMSEEEVLEKLSREGHTYSKEFDRYYPVHAEIFFGQHAADSMRYAPVQPGPDSSLYARERYPNGFYVIPMIIVEGDTLTDLEFSIATIREGKKSEIRLHSFRTNQADFYSSKKWKPYKHFFKKLFSER